MKVLVFGEVLWDIIDGKEHLGGAPLNFAAHVKQCGHESTIISAVGDDDRGKMALEQIEEVGVDVSMIQQSEIRTGFVPVTLVAGQPEYEIIKYVAYDYIKADEISKKKIAQFDTFYFGSLAQRSPDSSEALKKILTNHSFRQVFYDVNLRKDCYTKEILDYSLGQCTILKVNDEEVGVIGEMVFGMELNFEEFCVKVKEAYEGVKTIIITAGKDGCLIHANGTIDRVPTDPIKVVDTVGAGDSFSAAFMCMYATTQDARRSAIVANKVGGFVASNPGPIPKYSEEIKQLLK